jgi:hypothetical protein
MRRKGRSEEWKEEPFYFCEFGKIDYSNKVRSEE